jgi:hypothetical protein
MYCFITINFYRRSNRENSITHKKNGSLNRHYNSDGKQTDDENQDLVSFI